MVRFCKQRRLAERVEEIENVDPVVDGTLVGDDSVNETIHCESDKRSSLSPPVWNGADRLKARGIAFGKKKSTHLLTFFDDTLPQILPTSREILECVSDHFLDGLLRPEQWRGRENGFEQVTVSSSCTMRSKETTHALSFRRRPRNCMRTSKGSMTSYLGGVECSCDH